MKRTTIKAGKSKRYKDQGVKLTFKFIIHTVRDPKQARSFTTGF